MNKKWSSNLQTYRIRRMHFLFYAPRGAVRLEWNLMVNIEGLSVWSSWNPSVSAAQRVSSSHNGHQPAPDGRLRGTFHEASGRFVSPAGDQRERAPGQISATHSPLETPTAVPITPVTLHWPRSKRAKSISMIIFSLCPFFHLKPIYLFFCLFCRVKQIRGVIGREAK